MEYIYAALLLHKAGKEITEDTITAVLQAASTEVNESRVKALIAALEDVDIEEAMATAAVAAAPAAAAPAAAAEAPAAEAQKEEDTKEEAEESGMAGLGALFG
ncbi:50S ribosomal protein L12P [Methanomethylovorans hollandica DSM 15978]|uniref:Large ribosomal subunit protein P1 n=1 Tax=Methanomethylovorans hollandica (strain DSM 15978 / NBRC 107637 / DMS1) TaxID=867904 RepID=L0KZG3_METHD|nr:50S ribosomal protein P1 [Methanomethylovorans hollandica]AGB50501.1 50S ribosomal protein L12P [Methanomethylovorans hollandica DSM 15978]